MMSFPALLFGKQASLEAVAFAVAVTGLDMDHDARCRELLFDTQGKVYRDGM